MKKEEKKRRSELEKALKKSKQRFITIVPQGNEIHILNLKGKKSGRLVHNKKKDITLEVVVMDVDGESWGVCSFESGGKKYPSYFGRPVREWKRMASLGQSSREMIEITSGKKFLESKSPRKVKN